MTGVTVEPLLKDTSETRTTWIIRTLDWVPTLHKLSWNKDTSLIRTIILVPRVSLLERFHCTAPCCMAVHNHAPGIVQDHSQTVSSTELEVSNACSEECAVPWPPPPHKWWHVSGWWTGLPESGYHSLRTEGEPGSCMYWAITPSSPLPFLPTMSSLPCGNENRSPAVKRTHRTVRGYIQQQPPQSRSHRWNYGLMVLLHHGEHFCSANLK